jgi:hypothetical protein
MTDSDTSRELIQLLLVEHLCYKALALNRSKLITIEGRYSTSLLATMLKSMKTIIDKIWSIINTKDTKHSALLVQVIAIYIQ